jgi:hypothetical protein
MPQLYTEIYIANKQRNKHLSSLSHHNNTILLMSDAMITIKGGDGRNGGKGKTGAVRPRMRKKPHNRVEFNYTIHESRGPIKHTGTPEKEGCA